MLVGLRIRRLYPLLRDKNPQEGKSLVWLLIGSDTYVKWFRWQSIKLVILLIIYYINYFNRLIGLVGRVSPMVRETWVQSQVASYQRL